MSVRPLSSKSSSTKFVGHLTASATALVLATSLSACNGGKDDGNGDGSDIADNPFNIVGDGDGDGDVAKFKPLRPEAYFDFSLIWIANTNQGTVSKIDTETAKEIGRYYTGPGGLIR